MKRFLIFLILPLALGLGIPVQAQFSPGELSTAHAYLEGLNNCTKCHDIGAKVSDKKCLDCHKEVNYLITNKRGYHSSVEVKGKSCIKCHSEHHGREFDATRFDQKKFNHDLAGYKLQGKHSSVDCKECHKPDNIANTALKKRKGTFLGLTASCLPCHTDYHQGTLNKDCASCHGFDGFKPAPHFVHDKTSFPLKGLHNKVKCADCHKETVRNSKPFRQYADIPFASCTDCHTDVHNKKFGTKCTDCHSVNGWKLLKSSNRFNHDLTAFPLLGKHQGVDCAKCHPNGDVSKPVAHMYCVDCHEDYHKGEFARVDEPKVDCRKCHSLEQSFSYSSFGIEQHQNTDFRLDGAHVATPCISCHKANPDTRWSFSFASNNCVSCHTDIHAGFITGTYYPDQSCQTCHSTGNWSEVSFNHNATKWLLEGKHNTASCRQCHIKPDPTLRSPFLQRFKGLPNNCTECHEDVHGRQFELTGATDCARCHSSGVQWKITSFNHDNTKFPLLGKHKVISCVQCHKPALIIDGKAIIEYKIKNYQCRDCHSG